MKLHRLIPLLALVMLVAPAAAFAGTNPSGTDGSAGGTQGTIAESGGSLPFTGLNLVLIAVVGLSLVAMGVFLRRRGGSSAS